MQPANAGYGTLLGGLQLGEPREVQGTTPGIERKKGGAGVSKQDIIEKIKKAKRLAEKGVDGEKESAQKRVEEMMQRY